MIYTKRLLASHNYINLLNELELAERERVFCRHDLTHFMDVARIGRIINCEEKLGLDADAIYLVALLHDIGRIKEYENKTPHDEAGILIADLLLDEIDYPEGLRTAIFEAIAAHRSEKTDSPALASVIRRADKLSRPCFHCPVRSQCYWPENKKNESFIY